MLLAIDVGNTNTVFAVIREGREILHRWRISTQTHRTADEYMVWLNQLFAIEGYDRQAVTGAIISTVVPPTLFNLQLLCRRYFGLEAVVVSKDLDLGIAIEYPNPQEVGADRLVNAVAAHAELGNQHLIVIDFGTATTFDVVSDTGAYRGGIIAPGINLSVEALVMASAKLPKIAVQPPETGRVVGQSTVEAMQSGIFWGYVGLIEGLVGRIKKETGHPMRVIATGGLGVLFERHTDVIEAVDVDLTVKGLSLIYQRNCRT
ncbi:type III pantothenate kinase [Pedomonas sp. V897]|uniref:type III pantothenate kinase n=1 Tax=Pedomonas sp. V897 TaxID=3446482 RepID=UPI003EE1A1DB